MNCLQLTVLLVLLSLQSLVARQVHASELRFERVSIAGATMQLPRGWQRQQDEYSLILTENPNEESSPALALIAVQVPPGTVLAPADVAELVLANMELAAHGIQARQIEQRDQNGALYRLYQLQKGADTGFLASFTHTDSRAGTVVHMLFSALDQRFVALGGPMLPLVVFAGMDPRMLAQLQEQTAPSPSHGGSDECAGQSMEVCLAERWFSPGGQYATPSASAISAPYIARCEERQRQARNAAEVAAAQSYCNQVYATASQISAMSHRTSMSILHNINSGWCYRGEAGCY